MQLNIVYLSTNRDVLQRQAVTNSCLCLSTAHYGHAVGQAFGSKDVCLLTVCVADQCDVSSTVRIVFDADNLCRNAILVISLKVDDSVFSLSAAALMTNGDLTLVVTASGLAQRNNQRLLRLGLGDFCEIQAVICLLDGVYGLYFLIPIVSFSLFILFHGRGAAV